MTAQNTADIVIIDTGCANIASVNYALTRLGYSTQISADHDVIRQAPKLLLPGVGSAGEAMKNLRQRNLIELLPTLTQPVLGICLGMQLLAKFSQESDVPMLGIADVDVNLLQTPNGERLPHMGWNSISPKANCPLFTDIDNGTYFYFVHSFAVEESNVTAASCDYGQRFSASIQRDNFYGVQFHPERSAKAGAQLLKNFMELC